jgi:hypothetical protein
MWPALRDHDIPTLYIVGLHISEVNNKISARGEAKERKIRAGQQTDVIVVSDL